MNHRQPSDFNQIKAILFDVDGTLANTEKELTQATIHQLKQLAKRNYQLGLCTGRSYPSLKNYILPHFPQDSVHIVDDGGKLVTQSGKELFAALIPGSLVKRICLQARKMGADFGFAHDGVRYYNQRFLAQMQAKDKWCKSMANPQQLKDWSTACIGLYNINHQVVNFVKQLREAEKISAVEAQSSKNRYQAAYIKVAQGGIDKGSGAKRWAEQVGLNLKQIMVIGDSHNDLPVMQTVGLAIAMGNAVEPVKQIADLVIQDTDDDGLAKFLQKFLSQVKPG